MRNYCQFQFLVIVLVTLCFTSCSKDFEEENQVQSHVNEIVDIKRSCGHDHHMESLFQNTKYKKEHEAKFSKVNEYLNGINFRSDCSSPTIVPVVVHYQSVGNIDQGCLRQLAQNQINILNDDFRGTNGDISTWNNQAASLFPGVSNGDACIEFCIADQNHPNSSGLSNGDLAVTFNQISGDNASAWSGYLNIFVRPNLGYLGYSPLGGSGNGDGVVVDAGAFGAGNGCGSVSPQAPYNLGRTLTHEVGHYFLLDHIWGNGCNQDDDVADTPNQNSDYGGCPSLGASSCGSTDMHMNYMDYTNDQCMYMFSAGQADRMKAYLNSSLSSFIAKGSQVCSGNNGNDNGGDTGGDDNDDSGDDNDDGGQDNDDGSGDENDDDGQGDDDVDFCEAPYDADVQILSNIKVKITWTPIPDAIKYQVRFRKVNTGSWTYRSANNPRKTLNNLQEGTEYEYQLRTKCPTGWTNWSSKDYFMTSGGGTSDSGCTNITFELTLDDYGSETTWEIVDDFGSTLAAGGPYQDGNSGTKITKNFCFEDGCFTLYVDDAYGDGICCDYGNGNFKLKNSNGQTFASSNGNFGYYDYLDFCIDGNNVGMTGEKVDSKALNLPAKKKTSF